ncbi:DRC2 [Symbiodinium necroappetens]|uniref:Dynein regulatory complex subunit 2 n=1 Tax=Symbiodinium necroappetens TaxID=1628268 RepID=A0A813CFQ9_9DINO|nr:DRC2 [Symbiodinium necroappetens]
MPPKQGNATRAKEMEEYDKEQFMLMQQRHKLQKDTQLEVRNTKYNMSRIQESWLKIMRSAKTKQLKKQVEIISQNHERDVDRKDAILQMLDRDLDEAEEQHQVAVRSHLLNVDRLLEIQQSRLLALDEEFQRDVATLREEFRIERENIQERHALEKRELALIVEQVEREEKNREMADITDHQSQFELIRNKNIEEDHQMRSGLEEQIEETRARCKERLQAYEKSTESSTTEYKAVLHVPNLVLSSCTAAHGMLVADIVMQPHVGSDLSGLRSLRRGGPGRPFCGAHTVGNRAVVRPSRSSRSAVAPFAFGLSLGLSSFALARLSRRLRRRLQRRKGRFDPAASDGSLGHALVQAAARGPEGLDVKARAAYDLIRAAAEAGVKEFSSSGDFAAVGRAAAKAREELVVRAADEIRSGSADVDVVAEFLVDSALTRAARCAHGGGGIYSELWLLDEGRATVENIRTAKMADALQQEDGSAVARLLACKDILVDERPRQEGHEAPLFAQVQPYVFTRSTFLALLDVFEVFHQRRGQIGEYTVDERGKIEKLLDVVDRTPVMRRARAEAAKLEDLTDESWRRHMWNIWFQRHPTSPKCGFEHVFVGEATEDLQGRGVVGGLHNWVKFYLEEQRGAARYLGARYKGRTTVSEGALNPYFVSGRFTWDLEGKHLIKDVGGFFVGVSPEWQLAIATTAFFETLTPERAVRRQWSRDFMSRDVGYMRAARLGDHVYRICIRRNEHGNLTTFFAAQLGTWDARARAELDEPLTPEVLKERLQPLLVLHGFADEEDLLRLATRVASAGACNLRDALRHLHAELTFSFSDAAQAETQIAGDLPRVVAEVIAAFDQGRLRSDAWEELTADLSRATGLKGKKLLQPLRFTLTGRLKGHSLPELIQLLELMERLGAPWSSDVLPLDRRVAELRTWREVASAACTTKLEVEYLRRDASLSDQVERRLRQVERMQAAIQHWKQKIAQNRQECEERNQQLRTEKDHIAKHFQELKAKMNHFRTEGKKRLADLTMNARNCIKSLKDQLGLAERILKTAELCRKFETEREKVLPFYLSRDILQEFEEGELEFGDEDLKEEIRKELTDVGIDEWTYLDNFFKRYNKVKLDFHAVEQEGKRLTKENVQLRSILKQFLDGVSVNEDVLSAPNPLLVVNGKVNLNHVPVKRAADKTVYVEAAHHAGNTVVRR